MKEIPLNVQEGRANKKVYENLLAVKTSLKKLNKKRETYSETRQNGYIKNYMSLRHKEQPKFRRYNLSNVHYTNIKRPLKFSEEN